MRPRAQRSGFLEQRVGDQLVVFDQARVRLHVLDRTAALVWHHCDGRHTLAELTELVGRELGAPADESLVEVALAQLDEARLLEDDRASAPHEDSVSRREILHRAAAALVAGVVLPTVTSCGLPLEPTVPGRASLSMLEITTTLAPTTPPTTTLAPTTPPPTTTTVPPTTTTTVPPTTTSTTTSTTTTTTTAPPQRRVRMCHQGRAIMVDESAVAAHLMHGDTLGRCP